MSQLTDLMHRNLSEVFGQRDGEARRAAMRELLAPDMTFSDHDGSVTGLDAIDRKIQALHARTPGFVFTEAGPVHEVQELGSLDWSFGPAGADPVVLGTDVVLIRDGRIAALYTYLRS